MGPLRVSLLLGAGAGPGGWSQMFRGKLDLNLSLGHGTDMHALAAKSDVCATNAHM